MMFPTNAGRPEYRTKLPSTSVDSPVKETASLPVYLTWKAGLAALE